MGYTASDGTWREVTEKNDLENYDIRAKLYEDMEPDVKYSLVIEGEGEIKDLIDMNNNEMHAWQIGMLFAQEGNTVNVRICDGITGIGYGAFAYCRGVKSIKISNTVTSIGDWAFLWCSFTSIKIPNSVTSIGEDAFKYCTSLTKIIIHKPENSIEGYDTKWGAPDSTEVTWTGEE